MKKHLLVAGFASVVLLNLIFVPFSHAADYIGASNVLQKLADKPPVQEKKEISEKGKLKNDLADFKKRSAAMTPDEVATTWLALLDRSWKIPARNFNDSEDADDGNNRGGVANTLPPPAAWGLLAKKISERPMGTGKTEIRERCLRLFSQTLAGDRDAQNKEIKGLEELYKKADQQEKYMLSEVLNRIGEAMLAQSDDTNLVVKMLERKLVESSQNDYGNDVELPNLVTMIGTEKTEAFLRRALVKDKITLRIEGEATKKLARKIALELIDQLKKPQWQLAESLEAGALYEAMDKRFGKTENTETNESTDATLPPPVHHAGYSREANGLEAARTYYFLGLVSTGRGKEAVAVAQKFSESDSYNLSGEALKAMERAGYTKATHDFLKELLSEHPDLPFWDEYIELAAKIGEADLMLELARKAAARTEISDKKRNAIRYSLYKALLAAGQTEEGVKEIERLLGEKEKKPDNAGGYRNPEAGELAMQLAEVGQLLNRKEWLEEGINRTLESFKTDKVRGYNSYETEKNLAQLLFNLGRGPEAENVLVNALAKAAKIKSASDSYYDPQDSQQLLIFLAGLYHQAGRHDDVILLLSQSPDWGVKDLVDINHSSCGMISFGARHSRGGQSLHSMTAGSLFELGRKQEAKTIINSVLDAEGGADAAYELLVKIGGDDVSQRLDQVFATDRFEERPLIWKAVLKQKAGQLEEAENLARKAIAIDPSDGEEGPGDRMRAYSVLADIREALGDKKQADGLREAVKAIRLSEEADRFYQAGLLKQAIKMYEDSLTHFSDAYCIQSRLAIQMSALGMYDAAEEHYLRAYELMPDSFGRVESHCFGCERAFEGEKAQGMAEKVFSRLAVVNPNKPQVHYLLGYLREEQGRYTEAMEFYRKAVKLDPDYLNAWKHIESVGRESHLPQPDRDAIALQMLRLDPLNRHGGHDMDGVKDLKALWDAVENAAKLEPTVPKSLYVLNASKERIEKMEADAKKSPGNRYRMSRSDSWNYQRKLDPSEVVSQNRILMTLVNVLSYPIQDE